MDSVKGNYAMAGLFRLADLLANSAIQSMRLALPIKAELLKPQSLLWTPIYGFGRRYYVSEWGHVLNVERETLLSQYPNSKGYLGVCLYYRRRRGRKYYHTHYLVARHFIGCRPKPTSRYEVDHIDGNKLHNHRSNLEWVTGFENMRRRTLREHPSDCFCEICRGVDLDAQPF